MNRFAAVGLFVEAAKGKRIAVFTPRHADITDVLRCFERVPRVVEWPGVRIRHYKGDSHIDLGGRGRITLHSVRSNVRGISADMVFINQDADRSLDDGRHDDFHRDARAIVLPAPRGRWSAHEYRQGPPGPAGDSPTRGCTARPGVQPPPARLHERVHCEGKSSVVSQLMGSPLTISTIPATLSATPPKAMIAQRISRRPAIRRPAPAESVQRGRRCASCRPSRQRCAHGSGRRQCSSREPGIPSVGRPERWHAVVHRATGVARFAGDDYEAGAEVQVRCSSLKTITSCWSS